MPEINLVRLGHYHSPTGGKDDLGDRIDGWKSVATGSCRTALIVDNSDDATADPNGEYIYVGLVFWNKNGGMEHRSNVRAGQPVPDEDSFHLSADCPWKR